MEIFIKYERVENCSGEVVTTNDCLNLWRWVFSEA